VVTSQQGALGVISAADRLARRRLLTANGGGGGSTHGLVL
jgi:hypothetical protein